MYNHVKLSYLLKKLFELLLTQLPWLEHGRHWRRLCEDLRIALRAFTGVSNCRHTGQILNERINCDTGVDSTCCRYICERDDAHVYAGHLRCALHLVYWHANILLTRKSKRYDIFVHKMLKTNVLN